MFSVRPRKEDYVLIRSPMSQNATDTIKENEKAKASSWWNEFLYLEDWWTCYGCILIWILVTLVTLIIPMAGLKNLSLAPKLWSLSSPFNMFTNGTGLAVLLTGAVIVSLTTLTRAGTSKSVNEAKLLKFTLGLSIIFLLGIVASTIGAFQPFNKYFCTATLYLLRPGMALIVLSGLWLWALPFAISLANMYQSH